MSEMQRLVEENLRLVGRVLALSPVYDVKAIDEDYQEGVIGLMQAVEKFDAARGVSFTTFAHVCIWRAIQRGRKIRYGVNYRHAAYNGTFYQGPVSLDAVLTTDDGEQQSLGDTLAALPLLPDGLRRCPEVDGLIAQLSERERIAILSPIDDATRTLGIKRASVRRARVRTYERLRRDAATARGAGRTVPAAVRPTPEK